MRIWILILGFEGLISAFNPLRKGLVLRENNKKSQVLFSWKKMEKKTKTCLTDFQILMKRYFFFEFVIMNY